MINAVTDKLNEFAPIFLQEMDDVKLMDRTDTKFTFSINHLSSILDLLKEKYRVLEIEGNRVSRYETLYFDTPDLKLYQLHHSGRLNRHKVRHRTYVESKIGFLEVKFKNNKGRTFKSRIKEKEVCLDFTDRHTEFIQNKTPYSASQLVPTVWVNYSRITLVNRTSKERLTIDINLEFRKDNALKQHSSLVIAEVKQDGKAFSPFIEIMRKLHIREGSISKYCFAIASVFPHVKKNSFKPKLLKLQNIK